MTVTTTDLLLEATDVSKTYGAVVALRSRVAGRAPGRGPRAHGRQRRRQEHPRQDPDRRRPARHRHDRRPRPRARPSHSPGRGAPRRPRLRLPGAGAHPGPRHPVQPAADRDAGRAVPPLDRTSSGLEDLDLSTLARRLPLATLRIIDLARALAIEPDVLMLDEMTAALPANLTERVLEVVGRQRGGERSVIFISHRMIEIAAVCDRATVLREGETVGVVDVDRRLRGPDRRADARRDRRASCPRAGEQRRPPPGAADAKPRLAARGLADGHQAPGRLVRPLPGRGARGRRARGPGPGRAVRHPRRAPSGRAAASSPSTATPSRSATRRTPSAPASCTWPPTAPRRC